MRSVVVICWSIHIFVRRGQKEQLWKCCLSVWDTTWGARSTHFCICYCNTFCCNLILVIKKDAKTNKCCTYWKVKILPASACGEQYYNAARFSFKLSYIWMTHDHKTAILKKSDATILQYHKTKILHVHNCLTLQLKQVNWWTVLLCDLLS